MAAAGEASIGDEGHVLAKPLAHDGGGGREHFSHAGAALGSLVADDDDMAFFDGAVEDGFHGLFLGFKYDGPAAEPKALLAGNFGDSAFAGKIAAQDDEMAVLFDGVIEAADDGLA